MQTVLLAYKIWFDAGHMNPKTSFIVFTIPTVTSKKNAIQVKMVSVLPKKQQRIRNTANK